MKSDPASLDNLRDIVAPANVAWWPPAVGWWVLAAALLIVFTTVIYRASRSWHDRAYRRDAISELRSATRASEISEILKRAALVAFPRSDVASLSGDAWCTFLEETSGIHLSDAIRQNLSKDIFARNAQAPNRELEQFAVGWIKTHHDSNPNRQRRSDRQTRYGAS